MGTPNQLSAVLNAKCSEWTHRDKQGEDKCGQYMECAECPIGVMENNIDLFLEIVGELNG